MREGLLRGPGEIAAAWEGAERFDLAPKYADIFGVVVLGTGVAGAAGEMARALVAHTAQIPLAVVAGEELPAFVGPDNLVIACATGDDAEDTAVAFEEAADRGGKMVVVAAGEGWAARAVAHRAPLFALPAPLSGAFAPAPPLVALLATLHAAGVVVRAPDAEVAGAVAALQALNDACHAPSDDPAAPNLAEQVARHIMGRDVAVQGLGMLTPAAAWGRAAISAAAGTLALPDDYGMGDDVPGETRERTAIIALRSSYDPPRALARARAAAVRWEGMSIASVAIPVDSSTRLAAILWAMGFLGWVAHYLGRHTTIGGKR